MEDIISDSLFKRANVTTLKIDRSKALDVICTNSLDKNGMKRRSYIYVYNCATAGCDYLIHVQGNKNHSGKCLSCSHKGKPYVHILGELKKACIKMNREFSLTINDFIQLIEIPECHYCGDYLIFNKHSRGSSGESISRAYQLDRMDNNKGYTRENCIPCCWGCNRLKSNLYTYSEFMKLSPALKEIRKDRKLQDVDLSKVIEIDDNTDRQGELACAGTQCEIK